MSEISTRFFDDKEIRAVWDDDKARWWFSVVDAVAALTDSKDPRRYWGVLKTRLKRSGSQLAENCRQFKLMAEDGKKRLTDCITHENIADLVAAIPGKKAARFIKWAAFSGDTIDAKSKRKAYDLFGSPLLEAIEVGTAKGMRQIHGYLFGGLYDFAGQLRQVNISKGGFKFAAAAFLDNTLQKIEKMPENSFEDILDKYVEMNIAHPFMEGNGRSARIWLDLMLKKNLGCCVDWSLIDKKSYLDAMERSTLSSERIKALIRAALTAKTCDREMFMKGVDCSYYYEQEDGLDQDA